MKFNRVYWERVLLDKLVWLDLETKKTLLDILKMVWDVAKKEG